MPVDVLHAHQSVERVPGRLRTIVLLVLMGLSLFDQAAAADPLAWRLMRREYAAATAA